MGAVFLIRHSTAEPDTVRPRESKDLTVQYITPQADTIDFPAGQHFQVSLADSSAQYGDLISADNADTSDVLTDALQGFRFLADSAITDTANVVIEISTQYEGRALKEDVSVTIQPSIELEIVLPDSGQVWPTIPEGGVSSLFDFEQVENTLEEIIVTLFTNEKPVSGKIVTVTTEWIERTGGHDHNSDNDLAQPIVTEMGWIVNIAEEDSSQGQLETFTNLDGEIRLRYRAPEFGGQVRIVAHTVINEDTISVKDTMEVKIPGFVQLPNSNEYLKIGGTSSHNGPPLNSNDNNHYGTRAFVDSLISIADAWNELADSDSINTDEAPLRFNDMSLPNGGKFDIEGRWLTQLIGAAHDYHRVGRDVDIRTTRTLPNNGGRIGVLLEPFLINGETVYRNTVFEDLCSEKGANPIPQVHGENTAREHYHIYFYN